MFDQKFTSPEEIDRAFNDHIESLEMSGIPFDKTKIVKDWVQAHQNFEENKSSPPWLS